jgi:TRAP-type mannitol/chloroaromatic compound transport system substrate-binding protein
MGWMTKRLDRPDRRRVLGMTAVGLAGGLAAPAIARADAPIAWKMATAWPKDAPGGGSNARRLSEIIAAMSGGRLTVQPFADGELVAASELFDAVSAGTAELGHGTSARWQKRDPSFHFFSGVPFGFLGHEHAGWLRFGGGQALWERAYEPFGVLPFFAGSFGTLAAGWFRNPIVNLGDLEGLTMRSEGLGGEIWRRLGVNVVALPRQHILPAFKAGTIDAADWVGPWGDYDLGLASAAMNYYVPGFRGIGASIVLMANRAALDALPDDLQAVVRGAAAASAMETYADFTYNNISFLTPLAEAGVAIRNLPDSVVRAAGREAEALLREIAATSPAAGEAYESFVAFRAKAVAAAAHGDLAALHMRALALSG